MNDYRLEHQIAVIASWGYVVIASQYSGNGGSEGKDEFGGADVDDVLILRHYLKRIPQANRSRIGMFGHSRGGMMTYLCLARVNWLKAAVTIAGAANLEEEAIARPRMVPRFEAAFGNTPEGLKERSALNFAEKFCPTTPLLMLHGTADWRVSPKDSLALAMKLQDAKVPYRLVMLEGADHAVSEFASLRWDMTRKWFDRFVKNGEALPDLEPHGK